MNDLVHQYRLLMGLFSEILCIWSRAGLGCAGQAKMSTAAHRTQLRQISAARPVLSRAYWLGVFVRPSDTKLLPVEVARRTGWS